MHIDNIYPVFFFAFVQVLQRPMGGRSSISEQAGGKGSEQIDTQHCIRLFGSRDSSPVETAR